MAVGDGRTAPAELGDYIEIGITEVTSGEDPARSLVYLQTSTEEIMAFTPVQAMYVAHELLTFAFELHGDI